jgi:hypothetical protein
VDLITSPTIVALNTQSGAPRLAQAATQLIDALVLQVIDAATVRLDVNGNVVDVKTEVPLTVGAQVRLAARGYGDDARWVIVSTAGRTARGDTGVRSPIVQPATASVTPGAVAAPASEGEGEGETSPGGVALQHAAGLPQAAGANSRSQPAPAGEVNAAIEFVNATSTAAARQGGLAPVFAEFGALLRSPDLPLSLRSTVAQLLAIPAKLDAPSAATVRDAVRNSGLFLEARVASEIRSPALAPGQGTIAPGDLKAALFTLRQALQSWMASVPASASDTGKPGIKGSVAAEVSHPDVAASPARAPVNRNSPAPPYRGAPTAGQQPVDPAGLGFSSTPDMARMLLDHADGAIARQVLMQVASLPEAGNPAASHVDGSHWNLEIPFVTTQGVAVAQFEIERDGQRASAAEVTAVPWRVNFSVDVEPMGPVHAQIALTGKRAAVRIWAERQNTAAALRSGLPELSGALRAAALDSDDIIVRDGVPPRPQGPKPGRFLDRAS